MNAEAVNNRAKLLMHRVIARRLRQNPELIKKAWIWLDRDIKHLSDQAYTDWQELLREDAKALCRLIISRDERMTRLRLSWPLVNIVDLCATRERMIAREALTKAALENWECSYAHD